MTKSNATETDVLNLFFIGTALPWNAATDLEIHLHTADPGEGGLATTSECNYTSYSLVSVARSGTGWTVTGNSVTNDNLIQFPQCTGGSNVVTHVSISPAGSTQIIYSGPLNASLTVTNLIQPQFSAAALTCQED